MNESQKLLAEYAKTGSDAAFQNLVARYFDLVFSTALRLVNGDAHRAQDVAQNVFTNLAREAHRLSPDSTLGGWLHRNTCFVAAKTLRGERRRQLREQQAVDMNALNTPDNAFSAVAPLLDDAIDQLGEKDRKAILLRFYERQDLRAVGEALQVTENAAQKRIARALEQLHGLLTRQGIALPATVLGTLLAAKSVTAAPAGLSAAVAAAALAGSAAGTGSSLAFAKILTMPSIKLIAAGAVAIAAISVPLAQQRILTRMAVENRSLKNQLDQRFTVGDGELSTRQPATPRADNYDRDQFRANQQQSELLKLRDEVGRLRAESKQLELLRAENQRLRSAEMASQARVANAGALPDNDPLYVRTFGGAQVQTLSSKVDSYLPPGGTDSLSGPARHQALLRYLTDHGIPLEPPAAAYLNDSNETLIVRASMNTLTKVEKLVVDLPNPPETSQTGNDSGPQ